MLNLSGSAFSRLYTNREPVNILLSGVHPSYVETKFDKLCYFKRSTTSSEDGEYAKWHLDPSRRFSRDALRKGY